MRGEDFDSRGALRHRCRYCRQSAQNATPASDGASAQVSVPSQRIGRVIKEPQTYRRGGDEAIGQLMLHLLGAFAEFERSLIRERQAEGIRIAKAAGKYTGRQRRLDAEQVAVARADIAAGVPKAAVARKLGVDRTTLYRALALPQPDELAETEI